MKDKTDIELVNLIISLNSNDALKELTNRHKKLIYVASQKFLKNFTQLNDFLSNKELLVYNACFKYKPERAKFSSYLYLYVWSEASYVVKKLKRKIKNYTFIGIDKIFDIIDTYESTENSIDYTPFNKSVLKTKPKKYIETSKEQINFDF